MDALQFACWLQGFTELHGQPPTAEQWEQIRDHLQLVFKKVTPQRSTPAPAPPPTKEFETVWPPQPLRLDPIDLGPLTVRCSERLPLRTFC